MIWKSLLVMLLLGNGAQANQTVTHNGLTVIYRDARDKTYLPAVFQAWDKTARDLRDIGLKVPAVTLDAALNAADLTARTAEPVSVSAVTRGQTIYSQRLGALAQRGLLPLTIRHEGFHAAQPANLPRWLAEGLARLFSGEAKSDPSGATGLASLSEAQLNRALENRDPLSAKKTYQEASRRAARELRVAGWAGIWQR